MDLKALAKDARKGDKRAIGRLLSAVEVSFEILPELGPKKGGSYVLGLTGPPGAGKSTLMDKLIKYLRGKGKTVAVIAVDPTSPFSGGSILGDRLRMASAGMDPGVFIRSYASKESLGGLSRAARGGIEVFEWLGVDVVLIETVGMGQLGADIRDVAHTTCVVLVPGYGDTVQFMKAGIIELADLFVINKGDLRGARELYLQVKTELHQLPAQEWPPRVSLVQSLNGEGVEALWSQVEAHRKFLETSGYLSRKESDRRLTLFKLFLEERWRTYQEESLFSHHRALMEDVASGKAHPITSAGKVFDEALPSKGRGAAKQTR